MDISSPQITSIHRDYLYPEEYDVGNGPSGFAGKIFNGRGKDEVLFTKDCIEEVARDSRKIQQLQPFKDSIQAIDAGDEEGLAINAPHNYQRAQSVPLPDKLEDFESARLSIEYVTIPAGRSHEEIQKVVINMAMAVNTMLFNEQKILRRLEHSISQNMVQSAVQGLISQDAQSIHKGISKMFDNFSIMTRSVDSSKETVRLNNNYAINTHKHQQKLLEKFELLYKAMDLNGQQHFAEIEKALLHQNKLIMELSTRKESIQTKNIQPIQPIPSFSSLHPQTVVSHTCNANASPEILEGMKSMANTINSLAAQVASMRSSMDKMEKQLAGKSIPTLSTTSNITAAQGPPRQTPQRTITPRPQTPRPSTPTPTHQAQGPPPVNFNSKPKGAPGRPELYEDQGPNAFIADLSQGANWFLKRAIKAPDDQIHSWARVISATNWGYLSQNGFPLLCKPTLEVRCKRNFIILSIMRAFDSYQGCHKFLVPPNHPVPTTDINEMCNYYTFTFSSGLRTPPTRRGRITPSYYPGWTPEEVKARLDHNAKMRNPMTNPQLQNQPKTVSFADAAAGKKTNEVPKVLQKQNAQLDWSADNGRIDSDFGSDEVFYEDLYGGDNPTSFTTNNPNILAKNQSPHQAPKPTAPINPQTKRPAFQNRQIYTLRFSRDAPWKGIQTPAHIVTDKINVACSKNYNIKAILARWTEKNNLTITFSNDSKDADIAKAAKTIMDILAPGHPAISFSKPTIWNKIVYRQVPCRMITEAEIDGDAMREDSTWSKETLLKEVQESHPLLKNAEFAFNPDWTTAEIPHDADTWNLCFTIVDPDNSIAKEIVRSQIIMFVTLVTPDHWKERVNLQQCNLCWQLTGQHKPCMQHKDGKAKGCITCKKSCSPVCRLCGSWKHLEAEHNQSCDGCIQTGESMEKIKSKDWICTHLRCAVYTEPHFSDSQDCRGRNDAIQQARRHKPLTNQPFLTQESFQQHAGPNNPVFPSGYQTLSQGPNNTRYSKPRRPYALKNKQANTTAGPSNQTPRY